MTVQLDAIVKKVSEMSDEELAERVKAIRKNKYEAKPAKQRIVKKKKQTNIKALFKGMTKEQIQALLKEAKGE